MTRLLRVRWAASRSSTSTQVWAGMWARIACWCTISGLVCQADQVSRTKGKLRPLTARSTTGVSSSSTATSLANGRRQDARKRSIASTVAKNRITKMGAE